MVFTGGGFTFRHQMQCVGTPCLGKKKIMPSEPIPEYVAYLHPPAIHLSSLLHVCFNALSSGPYSPREGSPGRHEPPPCRHEPPQFARQIGPPPLCSKSLCYARLPYNSWFLHACNIESSLFFISGTRILLKINVVYWLSRFVPYIDSFMFYNKPFLTQ